MTVPASPNGESTTTQAPAPEANGLSGGDAAASSREDSPAPSTASDWLRDAFRERTFMHSAYTGERREEPREEPTKEAEPAKVESPAATEPKPFRVLNSQAELDRLVQSETDRTEAIRQQRQKQAEEDELLETAPHLYAQRKREEKEQQEQQAKLLNSPELQNRMASFANEHILDYDEKVLKPLEKRIADSPEKTALLSAVEPGIEGRGKIAAGFMDLYEKQIRADARLALANDPAFIKEILVKHGGQRAEPEVVSSVAAAPRRADSQDDEMNSFLRGPRRR